VYNKKLGDNRVGIRVFAGSDLEHLAEVGRIANTEDVHERFDLSAIARGKKSIHVRLELRSTDLEPDVLDWCAIRAVRFTLPWPTSVKEQLPDQTESIELSRKQNLL